MTHELQYDQIGYWSEVKLDIIREYASAYSQIISRQEKPKFYHIYIDALAGAGKHVSRKTGEFVLGSPANALLIEPPFREYHFIDLVEEKVKSLERLAGSRSDVKVYHGDCNQVLLQEFIRVLSMRTIAEPFACWTLMGYILTGKLFILQAK